MFSSEDYIDATERLRDAATQLEPDGHGCHVCGDSGHQAFECGRNPLVAVATCKGIAQVARELHDELHVLEDAAPVLPSEASAMLDKLHDLLHYLAGYDIRMGMQVGPASVR